MADAAEEILENAPFDEIRLDQSASLLRTLSMQDIEAFAAVSGDLNPSHLDPAFASKTLMTLNKSGESRSGSMEQEKMRDLISNISVAKGLLATLSLGHPSLWIRKYQRMDPEHLRILLLEVMDEIYTAQDALSRLK